MRRIISLSTIPPRFPFLGATLESLASQQTVDEVRIYIPKRYRRFPEYDGSLPDVPEGVTVCRIEDDLGPATKILPAARDFRGQDVQILFCDDDLLYPAGWARRLFDAQAGRPTEAVATMGRIYAHKRSNPQLKRPHARQLLHRHDPIYRAGRLFSKLFGARQPLWRPTIFPGYIELLFGAGGVVVRPDFFDDEAFDIPEEAWPVDDIWLSAQLARKQIPIYCPWRFPCAPSAVQADTDSLLDAEFMGATRQESNREAVVTCQQRYGIWK